MSSAVRTDASAPAWRRIVRWCRLLAIVLALALLLVMIFENHLVFVPTSARQWVEPQGIAVEDIWLESADGNRIHAWWCPVENAQATVLYCHGNGGNLSSRGPAFRELVQRHRVAILGIDYPGYGHSPGRPTEAGCYAAAEAGIAWLTARGIAPGKVILFGESLGGGVVVEMATRHVCRGVVLFSTFTSVPEVARDSFFFPGARLFMRNRFDNLAKIRTLDAPLLVAHGDADGLIPLRHARKLFEAAPGPKMLHIDQGRDHDLTFTPEFHSALAEFLRQHGPRE